MFVGRERELSQLEDAYSAEKFKFIAVIGRNGSGKTRLLEEFCREKPSIFFTAADVSSRANLNDFSRNILNYYHDKTQSAFHFWDNAFCYIAERQHDFSLVLVIDDFDILVERDPAFIGLFTKSVHNVVKYSKVFLVITCSSNKILKSSLPVSLLSEVMELGNFLTEENIKKLKQEEIKQTPVSSNRHAKFYKASADKVILREGTINESMYKIICGRAVCYANYGKDDEIAMGSLKEGQTFGEYSLLTGEAGIYTVVAFTDMLILSLDYEGFKDFIATNIDNSIGVMKNLAGMLRIMRVNMNMLHSDIVSMKETVEDAAANAKNDQPREDEVWRTVEVTRSGIKITNK